MACRFLYPWQPRLNSQGNRFLAPVKGSSKKTNHKNISIYVTIPCTNMKFQSFFRLLSYRWKNLVYKIYFDKLNEKLSGFWRHLLQCDHRIHTIHFNSCTCMHWLTKGWMIVGPSLNQWNVILSYSPHRHFGLDNTHISPDIFNQENLRNINLKAPKIFRSSWINKFSFGFTYINRIQFEAGQTTWN